MNKTRKIIYIKINQNNEIVFSGIGPVEFIRYYPFEIEDVMIISGGSEVLSSDSRFERCFELIDG